MPRFLLVTVLAALPSFAAQPPQDPCAAPERRQFDFWIGEWEVRRPDGVVAGTNRIEAVHGGCALKESWTGATGTNGTSLNSYDPASRTWHQTWVDSSGTLLLLDGGLDGGRMVLKSAPQGGTLNRITWSKVDGGRVRQLWETSQDGGKSWSVAFDGLYVPKKQSR